MIILFFSRLFYPHIGGVEKHVIELSKILVDNGHKVIVVTEKHDKGLKDRENIKGIEVYRIEIGKNEWFKKFTIWKWLWENKTLINTADIIHCHDVFFWYLPFKFIYPFKKVFTTFHGYERYPISKKAILVRKISEKMSLGNICVGDFMKKWYGVKPDYVVYGGVSIVRSEKSSLRKGFRQAQGKNSVGAVFVGRLDEQTGIKTYINAVKLIKEQISDFKFEIIGDGKFRGEIEKDFEVLGFKENSEKYFRKYKFVFVSRYLSILEALFAKKLVFALCDNPIKEDYLRMSPFSKFIVIAGSKEELADKVLYFLKYPQSGESMIDAGFNWVKNQTWENLINIYLRLWSKYK